MKRLIALFLLLSMLLCQTACSAPNGAGDGEENVENNDNNLGNNGDDETVGNQPAIVVPEYKDYERGSVDFDKLVYSRPNMEAIIRSVESAKETVSKNEVSVLLQIEAIRSLEIELDKVDTMYTLAEIYRSKDSTVEFWQDEYGYISTNYPKLSMAVEDLLEVCALSENKKTFEEEYFDYSLDEYLDGGIYTDEVVSLMEEEARLESEFSSLSTATVEIVYNSIASDIYWEGTTDEVIAMAKEHFKDKPDSFERVLIAIDLIYENKLAELKKPIFIELIKVRRLIADELGLDSYSELAYESLGYDYAEDEMKELLKNVGMYASKIAEDLEYRVFGTYFQSHPQPAALENMIINNLYDCYKDLGGEYFEAFSYMLQHGLYDIKKSAENRFSGAFTAYIRDNASPYIFMSASGFIKDYTTLSHEFGHFLDSYVNNGNDASLSISEISSQALELLSVLKLKRTLPAESYQYLEYYTLFTFLNSVLLNQSFYSEFEHMVYELEYDEITEDRLERIVEEAFTLVFSEDMKISGNLDYVITTHTALYPFYVESYVTSGITSLEIFFKESYRTGKAGDGFEIYETLIKRGDTKLTTLERLELCGLDSPFKDGKIKEIANNIYYQITGSRYYKDCNSDVGAA